MGVRSDRGGGRGTVDDGCDVGEVEVAAHDIGDRVRCRGEYTLEIVLAKHPIAECLPIREIRGLSLHGLRPPDPAGFEQSLRAFELARLDPGVSDVGDLRPDRAGGRRRGGGRTFGVDHEDPQFRGRVVVRGHARRELPLPDGTVKARTATGTEDERREIEQGRVPMERWYGAPAQHDLRLRDVPAPFAVARAGRRAPFPGPR